jgi:hypothetical protein
MKYIKWLILVLVLLLLAAPFFLEDRYGQPLLKLSDLTKADMGIPQMLERLPDVSTPKIPGTAPEKIYTWTDEQGQVHYSNQPPPPQVQAKSINVDPDANVIRLDKAPGGSETGQGGEQKGRAEAEIYKDSTFYAPRNVQKLAEDAQAVEETLEQRKQEYDRVIDQ